MLNKCLESLLQWFKCIDPGMVSDGVEAYTLLGLRAILELVCTLVPSTYPQPLGIYLLVVTATSPPCPSADPAAPSTARSGLSPRDPTSQLCERSFWQRGLPHLQLLPSTQQGLRPLFFPHLTSEGTRVQTCSSEAGQRAERQDCGAGVDTLGKVSPRGDV